MIIRVRVQYSCISISAVGVPRWVALMPHWKFGCDGLQYQAGPDFSVWTLCARTTNQTILYYILYYSSIINILQYTVIFSTVDRSAIKKRSIEVDPSTNVSSILGLHRFARTWLCSASRVWPSAPRGAESRAGRSPRASGRAPGGSRTCRLLSPGSPSSRPRPRT